MLHPYDAWNAMMKARSVAAKFGLPVHEDSIEWIEEIPPLGTKLDIWFLQSCGIATESL
jgi:hypothetical protein